MANKSVADVMKLVKDNEVKFVDFRFTDTRGKEQHVSVPVSHFDEDKFTSGPAFDGSSIAGWKGIEASDMLLMPDPNTANVDPFFEEPTLLLTCDVLEPGEVREFFILSEENEDGQLTLSVRRIEYMRAWERVRQLQKEDATIYSEVFATNRGGALVRVEGLRGFIPGSHISTRKAKEELVADFLPLKFLEVDEESNRLVLSHRRALVERKMNRLEVGEVVLGTVRGIKPYGAFIDIGGVSGLLHISEISHEHIETPHTVLNVNDQMKVMIIDLDAERGRISLSTKALEPEPGDMLTDPQKVFEKAEEMAARYKQMLLEQAEDGEPMGVTLD